MLPWLPAQAGDKDLLALYSTAVAD